MARSARKLTIVDQTMEAAAMAAPTWDDYGDVLTPQQVAAILQVSDTTVYRMVNTGVMPSFKVGGLRRIHKAALMQWIDDQTI